MSSRASPTRDVPTRATAVTLAVAVFIMGTAGEIAGQDIRGRITDAQNQAAVGLASIFLLDADRRVVARSAADTEGHYEIAVPAASEYYLVAERLGYFPNESPLLSVAAEGAFRVDMELRPEPFRLDPLEVTVRNEELVDFLRLEFGVHPATLRGYRTIQGVRLAEARAAAVDNTDLLRKLYIPVSHGIRVCINSFGPGAELPERMSHERVMNSAASTPALVSSCGSLFVDGYRCRNEHIEEIVMDRIAVVVTLESEVHLYTRDFDWTFRPGGGSPAC